MILCLVAFQVLLAALYAPASLDQFRSGEISALTFLAWVLASLFLMLGGLVFLHTKRMSGYFFLASASLGALAYLQWRPAHVLAGLLVAVCAGLVSSVSSRRSARGQESA